ncbi:MAG: sulfotransferase [Deltaproteobacteria bacterium]|nr:sulfotransferase [Deltaproteobacteria bacterium]
MIDSPVFLVGAERSGTTLLRLMLDHHPRIAFHHEFEFAVDMLQETGDGHIIYPDLRDYYNYLNLNRIFLDSNFKINRGLPYDELINDFLLQKQSRSGKPFVGATVHRNFHYLNLIWPKAKFIHIVRDGRDVALSTVKMGWAGNMYTGAKRWLNAEKTWDQLSAQLPGKQQLTVFFEDLIENPTEILSKICQFIGVPFEERMFNYIKHSTYSSPDTQAINKWKKLKPFDIRICESQIAFFLTKKGYSLSGLPKLEITRYLMYLMAVQDRIFKIKFRIKRYSFKLWFLNVFSRWFHYKAGVERIKYIMNRIDREHLK